MDMENLNGQMGENMKEIIKMIKKKGMELLVGLTEGNIEGIGKMEDKMEKGSFIILKIKNGKKEYGKKEKEQNGLIDIKIFFNKINIFIEVEKKNNILNDIIELLLKYKNNNEFLIFSYKISLKIKYNFSRKDGRADLYEESLIEQIKSVLFQKESMRALLEEIILNSFFIVGTSLKIENLLSDSSTIDILLFAM